MSASGHIETTARVASTDCFSAGAAAGSHPAFRQQCDRVLTVASSGS